MHATAGFALAALSVLVSVHHATAVCAPGQMAIGKESISMMAGENWIQFYSGFLMANDCGIISQNGETESVNQQCAGDYNGGASVTCNGSGVPTAAVDTVGQHWHCSPTSDTSCDKDTGINGWDVLVCCDRN